MKLCFKKLVLLICLIYINGYTQTDSLKLPPNAGMIVHALNFKDADIRDILRSIAFEYKTNINVDNKINARISTALFNVSVKDAVRMIAEDNGFEFGYDTHRFFVKPVAEKIPPPPPEALPEIVYNDGKVDIKLNNVDVVKFIEKLRAVTGKNYLLSNGSAGRLTGSLANVDIETGLRNILQNNGFYLTTKDSIYYISRSDYYSSLDNNDQSKRNGYWVSAKDGKVTLSIVQANLDKVINDIANQLNLQVIKLTPPTSTVTLRCTDLPVGRAFDFLFRGTEFTYKEDHGAYVIGSKTSKNMESSRMIKLHFLRAEKVKEKLPPDLLQGATVNTSVEHNAIVVTGPIDNITNIENYLNEIDKSVPQVLIEALVVDYNLNNSLQFGITAATGDSAMAGRANKYYPGIDLTASGQQINQFLKGLGTVNIFGKDINLGNLGKLSDNFYLNVKALEQKGIANVKSKPVLSTLNGHTASLKIGTVQNYVFNEIMPVTNQLSSTYLQKERIEKIEANISFEITPWVGPDGEMTLEIKPEFQTPIGEFVPDKKLIPAINTRAFSSTVRLKDGETIILGGLIQETETNTKDKFPILGDLPFIGEFFSNTIKKKGKAELVIYITPRIFYGDESGYQIR